LPDASFDVSTAPAVRSEVRPGEFGGEAHDDRHGIHLPALLQDDVQADPLPERGRRYTVASFY
jgi:hypothetical protein